MLASQPLVHTALSSLNAEFISEASVNGIIVGKSQYFRELYLKSSFIVLDL